jgi:hypothetical protein
LATLVVCNEVEKYIETHYDSAKSSELMSTTANILFDSHLKLNGEQNPKRAIDNVIAKLLRDAANSSSTMRNADLAAPAIVVSEVDNTTERPTLKIAETVLPSSNPDLRQRRVSSQAAPLSQTR